MLICSYTSPFLCFQPHPTCWTDLVFICFVWNSGCLNLCWWDCHQYPAVLGGNVSAWCLLLISLCLVANKNITLMLTRLITLLSLEGSLTEVITENKGLFFFCVYKHCRCNKTYNSIRKHWLLWFSCCLFHYKRPVSIFESHSRIQSSVLILVVYMQIADCAMWTNQKQSEAEVCVLLLLWKLVAWRMWVCRRILHIQIKGSLYNLILELSW